MIQRNISQAHEIVAQATNSDTRKGTLTVPEEADDVLDMGSSPTLKPPSICSTCCAGALSGSKGWWHAQHQEGHLEHIWRGDEVLHWPEVCQDGDQDHTDPFAASLHLPARPWPDPPRPQSAVLPCVAQAWQGRSCQPAQPIIAPAKTHLESTVELAEQNSHSDLPSHILMACLDYQVKPPP